MIFIEFRLISRRIGPLIIQPPIRVFLQIILRLPLFIGSDRLLTQRLAPHTHQTNTELRTKTQAFDRFQLGESRTLQSHETSPIILLIHGRLISRIRTSTFRGLGSRIIATDIINRYPWLDRICLGEYARIALTPPLTAHLHYGDIGILAYREIFIRVISRVGTQ